MIKNVITSLSKVFLDEAKNSPQLLADMAAMEKYMAESYGERIFIELLQNADDAGSTKIQMIYKDRHVFFANNGKPFDAHDIESISRSGSSSKERGNSIGYRGVGFKSVCYLTNEILIYSDDTYFTFSKSVSAKHLNIDNLDTIPTIRVPFVLDEIESSIKETVDNLINNGFSTIFIFKDAKINLLNEEMKLINDGYFLFLKNLCDANISVTDTLLNFQIIRENKRNLKYVTIQGHSKQSWLIISDKFNKHTSLAFKVNDEGAIQKCTNEEAVFHCYLPTLEKNSYLFKVNSDFSTDPSRKHLTLDCKTEKSIGLAAKLLYEEIATIFSENASQNNLMLIEIVKSKVSFSKFASILADKLNSLLQNNRWLILESGESILPSQFKIPPNWLEASEFNLLRKKSEYVHSNTPLVFRHNSNLDIDDFLRGFSSVEYSVNDFIAILSETNFIESIDDLFLGKLYSNFIKLVRNKSLFNKSKYDIETCLIKTRTIIRLSELKDVKALSPEFCISFKENVFLTDVEWFDLNYGTNLLNVYKDWTVDNANQKKTTLQFSTSTFIDVKKNKSISKWRAAEQQCVEFEQSLGNKARDVSKQNLGYDVESIDELGRVRYIEVKSISKGSPYFSMTNNEYSAAHQHGDNYYICVIQQENEKLTLIYIKNPVNTLNLEKRVRQWEWVCENYSGEQFVFDLE